MAGVAMISGGGAFRRAQSRVDLEVHDQREGALRPTARGLGRRRYAASFESVLCALECVGTSEEVALKPASVTATVGLAPIGQGGFRLTVRLKIEFEGLEHRQA
jgi:hypothetical protein